MSSPCKTGSSCSDWRWGARGTCWLRPRSSVGRTTRDRPGGPLLPPRGTSAGGDGLVSWLRHQLNVGLTEMMTAQLAKSRQLLTGLVCWTSTTFLSASLHWKHESPTYSLSKARWYLSPGCFTFRSRKKFLSSVLLSLVCLEMSSAMRSPEPFSKAARLKTSSLCSIADLRWNVNVSI